MNPIRKQQPVYRVAHVLEATVGGTREHVMQLLTGLDRDLFDLTLICSIERDTRFAQDIAALRGSGIRVVVIPMAREIRPIRDLVAFVRLVAHLALNRYDVVHTHSSKAGFLGRLAAWATGVRHIYHTGHIFYFQWRPDTWSGRFYRLLEWFAARLSQRIIALSAGQRDLLIRCGIARPPQVRVIENGVRLADWAEPPPRAESRQRLGLPAQGLVVGMAARIEPQKGCSHFLLAAKRVLVEIPDARFVLAGEGRLVGRIEEQARDLLDGDRFRMLGHCRDMRAFYSALDLFVLTSLWEGMPYVLLEAMAAGCPVCATDVPGTRDLIIPGKTGTLVPPERDDLLAEHIVALLRDPEARMQMASRAREIVRERFTAERCVGLLQGLYLTDLSGTRNA